MAFTFAASFLLLGPIPLSAETTITLDFDREIGTLAPELLGVNHPATTLAAQANLDTLTGLLDPAFVEGIAPLGLKNWRYPGGTPGGSYFWWKGLGDYPRDPGFAKAWHLCLGGETEPYFYYFGFMEFVQLLDQIDAEAATISFN